MKYISFPGLGIKTPFSINKSFPFFFGREIAWYGVIICVGIILAITYALFRSKKEQIKTDHVVDLSFFLVIFGIIGARLYYVTFEYKSYLVTGLGFWKNVKATFMNVIGVWNGGLAIYGAIIAGFLTILIFCKIKKIKLVKMLDIAAPSVMIGQIIGRWGNFINVEAYGRTTNLPWKMGIHESKLFINESGELVSKIVTEYVHPTFLYESLWNLVGFVIANILYRKKKFDGQIFCFYIAWYGFGRMLIEGLRTDSLMVGPVRVSQLVGLLTFIAGVVLMVLWSVKAKKKALYEEVFGSVEEDSVEESEDKSEEESEELTESEETEECENTEEETTEETEITEETTEDDKNN